MSGVDIDKIHYKLGAVKLDREKLLLDLNKEMNTLVSSKSLRELNESFENRIKLEGVLTEKKAREIDAARLVIYSTLLPIVSLGELGAEANKILKEAGL